ncbi:hypothetical protein [Truepera radiovictrix]|uniref:Uncharacterized protein n=1 Tax=Truepera radiovictrix (strain DSM 17093 / CIP 108686 / LMG 22925 / RQ-24) TaxID=649638 RepID=D7CQR3_TRURR|nr:hypothetical protein [Truepera radiovictrix]ADI15047.1 conserved hypothetical protein [Truepera radiovictrix DSM 17093]WMT56400.1 hypothetical protein RCV51_10330 [Truepera radiovictrix]
MVIGQTALRSPAFSERLSALLRELQARGCTVWLEGMTLRFDVPEGQLAWVRAGGVSELLGRYGDVVLWLPEELPSDLREAQLGFQPVWPRAPAAEGPAARTLQRPQRWPRFGARPQNKSHR